MLAARFLIKVYAHDGTTYKETIDANAILNIPSISREVSKSASDVTFQLARPWNDFGLGTTLNEGYFVKVYAVNDAHPTGTLVYQGFIVEIKTSMSGSPEIKLFPLELLLGNAFWKSGGTESLADYTITYAGADVDTMFSDAITNANTVHGAWFTTSLGNPGKSISVNFVENTHMQAITTAMGFLDDTWYWRVTPSGVVQLRQYADAVADHTFVFGKHIASLDATRTIVNVKNGIRVQYTGPAYSFYHDATSESAYGKRQVKLSNSNIQNSGSADDLGNGTLANLKNAKTNIQVTINAQYDLESIQPGDTCRFQNIDTNTSQMVTGIFRILRVQYDGTQASLQLAEIVSNFGIEFTRAIS